MDNQLDVTQNTVQHCLYIDVPGLEVSVHEKVKMLQESYHPGLAIPRWSVSVWTLYAQNDQFLYDSIVHPYYKGSTDKTAVVYTIGVYGYNK